MNRLRATRSGDEGVTLIIVLCFMVLVSVIALGLLGLGQASFESSGAVKVSRQRTYAADAGMELAVSNVAQDKTGDVGTPDGGPCTYKLSGINGNDTVVTCAPLGTGGQWNNGRSRNALLTLSTASDSLLLQGNNPLYVNGPVYSKGDVTTAQTGNLLNSSWTVRTEGTGADCTTSKVTADRGKFCHQAAIPAGDDPGWTLPSTSLTVNPLTDTRITCTPYSDGKSKGGILSFPAGRYVASPMTALTLATNVACLDTGSTLYFNPGVYVFAGFTFTPSLSIPGNPAYEVVAGTANGSWLKTSQAPPGNGTDCDNSQAGAQFVLQPVAGVPGKIVLENYDQSFALCAGPGAATQPALAVSAATTSTGTLFVTPNKPNVYVTGAVYLPGATADLTMHNKAETYFIGGIVANKLIAEVSASFKQSEAPIFLPACSSTDPCRSNRRVAFTAKIGTAPALTSVVDFDDDYGNTPGKVVTVKQWSSER